MLSVQLVMVFHEIYSLKDFFSLNRKTQISQETTKSQVHAMLHLSVMAIVLLSQRNAHNAPSHVHTMIFSSFLTVLDTLPLRSLLRVHAVKLACFVFLEGRSLYLGSNLYVALQTTMNHTITVLLLGTILPLWLTAMIECRQRIQFLRECGLGRNNLGMFWDKISRVLDLL